VTYARPDLGPDIDTGTPPASQGWMDTAQGWVADKFDLIPGWIWATSLGLLLVAALITLPLAKKLAYKAGQRVGKPAATVNSEARRDRRLLIAVLIPAILFWLTVLVGSGRSLTAFGRQDLNWRNGWDWLVPFTLDGVAVVFGALAFRALAKQRNPDRAYRVVWIATGASAGINFFHEVGGSKLGAGYLAILSLFGMLIFHELLAQFEEGTEWIQRDNPKFGLRWITWPSNTVCAWIAWRNYPVSDGRRATIAAAVEHLDWVRATKRIKRAEQIDSPAWWMRLAPWAHVGALQVVLSEQRSAVESEQARNAALIASSRDAIEGRDRSTEQMAERFRLNEQRIRSEAAEREQELLRKAEERLAADRAEHAAELETVRAEHAGKLLRLQRSEASTPRPTSRNAPAPRTSAPARMSDADALRQMFQEHSEPNYAWTDREVNRITGAGFSSRAPRLTGMAVKHLAECPEQSHKTCYTERSGAGSDDAEERAS